MMHGSVFAVGFRSVFLRLGFLVLLEGCHLNITHRVTNGAYFQTQTQQHQSAW